jgi:hypothetical protein
MQTRSKIIRRVIIALEILILVAAFVAIRYAASLPKHYQIVYHRYVNGGIDLVQPGTEYSVRLLDMPFDSPGVCDINLMTWRARVPAGNDEMTWTMNTQVVQEPHTEHTFTDYELGNLTKNSPHDPILLDFRSVDTVNVIHDRNYVHITGQDFSIRAGTVDCYIMHSDGG